MRRITTLSTLSIATILILTLGACSGKKKETATETQSSSPATELPGGIEPDVAAPPVDVSTGEETEILQEVNKSNDKGAQNISANHRLIKSEYDLDTHTVIRITQFTTPVDDSREARLAMKHKFVEQLRNSAQDLDRLQRGVTYRYEFIGPDGEGLYMFNITKNDLL